MKRIPKFIINNHIFTAFILFHNLLISQNINIDKLEILNQLDKVFDWQIQNEKYTQIGWENCTFYKGVLALYNTTNNNKYLDYLTNIADENHWEIGKPKCWEIWNYKKQADFQCISQIYIGLYNIDSQSAKIIDVKLTFDNLVENPVLGSEKWWWVDALFMAPPALVDLFLITGNQSYLDVMHRMWWDVVDFLLDEQENLFYRDKNFFGKTERNGQKVFWSRGNGWALAALIQIINSIPENYTVRKKYIELYSDIVKRITGLQSEDGFWRSSLLDPQSYPEGESSGTALFCYAITKGINSGLLDSKDYFPIVVRAWEALQTVIDKNGRVQWVQKPGFKPKRVKKKDLAPYGSGAFLLAGSEIIKLNIVN